MSTTGKDFYHCESDKLHDECGVFGIYDNDELDVARLVYYGLYALQHRGQESSGIAICKNDEITNIKGMGLVPEVFPEKILNRLEGGSAIGHNRYSTTGGSSTENAQPLLINYKYGKMALAHNGNLVNAGRLRGELEEQGAIFQTTTDSEIIASVFSRNCIHIDGIKEALAETMRVLKGSYAVVILTQENLIGMRDPWGLRPLCIGRLKNSFVLASESCALNVIGASFVRDVAPGEIIFIGKNGMESVRVISDKRFGLCIFEHIYLARPDSFIDGASVYRARLEAGRLLAKEHPVDADMVVGVPDSGLTAAIGYSRESGIPYGEGFVKNRYVGRTFINPDQKQREQSVRIKLNPLEHEVRGKRLVLVDDSIVRGTTSAKLVQALKDAGALEVHMRISSPPIKYPCFFGIDIASCNQLIASSHTVEEIRRILGADSLGFLSLDGVVRTPVDSVCTKFCTACISGNYPIKVQDTEL